MKIVDGVYTSAKIFTDNVEDYALAQIQMLCDNAAFADCQIRIMPDVHPGKVGTIGFTARIPYPGKYSGEDARADAAQVKAGKTKRETRILPNVVGVDIGCGVTLAKLKQKKVEFQKLDKVIRECVPSGARIRKKPHRFVQNFDGRGAGKLRANSGLDGDPDDGLNSGLDSGLDDGLDSGLNGGGAGVNLMELYCVEHVNMEKAELSIGTLGGGNHFIELDRDDEGSLYVVIHSGSRRLGSEVTEYYVSEGHKALKKQGLSIPYELTYLKGALLEAYLHDVEVVQRFAEWNRNAILDELARGMKWKVQKQVSSVHNYIEYTGEEIILRKGAVSARAGEPVVIPVNMRDGILLGVGKGNADWNFSAPHGSGRKIRRDEVKSKFTVHQFKTEMKGIYSSCIGTDTLDEAPFAYRDLAEIRERVEDGVEIRKQMCPVYSFKAGKW